jgi:hypothetical protein
MAAAEFERLQIESVLGTASLVIRRGLGLHLMSVTPQSRVIFDAAVRPAMHNSGLDVREMDVLARVLRIFLTASRAGQGDSA